MKRTAQIRFCIPGLFLLLSASLLLIVPGCAQDPHSGYALHNTFRKDVHSISVPIFGNATFERGLELRLTDAIIKELQARTPYTVNKGGAAETTLTGTITDVRRVKLSTDRTTGLTQELAIRLTINFEWKDERTGEIYVARRSFSSGDVVVPAPNVRESLETGINQAIQELAVRLTDSLRSDW